MMREIRPNLFREDHTAAMVTVADQSEIDLQLYTRYNVSTGLIHNIILSNILVKYKYQRYDPNAKGAQKIPPDHYIPIWYMLLFKSTDRARKKMHSFLSFNTELIDVLDLKWRETKDLQDLYTILKQAGFRTPLFNNIFKFHYLGNASRYFNKEKCYERFTSLISWDRVSEEDQIRNAPLEQHIAESRKIRNQYL